MPKQKQVDDFEFDAVEDDDKADHYSTKLEEFAAKVRDPDPNKLSEDGSHPVNQQIENTIDSVDETITTIQEDKNISKNEIQRIKKDVKTLDEIEKEGHAGYHLTIREIKDNYKKLHERTDSRIIEWLSYIVELENLQKQLYENLATKLNEERVATQTVDQIQSFMEDRQQQNIDILTDRFNEYKRGLDDKVETKVQAETSELREKVIRLETEMEHKQDQFEQAMEIIADLTGELQQQGREPSTSVQRKASELKQDVENGLTEKAAAAEIQTESSGRKTVDGANNEKNEKSEESGNLFSDVDTADEDGEEEYEFYGKSGEDLKAVFERVEENEDTESMSCRDLAEKSDVSHESVRKKARQIREQYGDDTTQIGR